MLIILVIIYYFSLILQLFYIIPTFLLIFFRLSYMKCFKKFLDENSLNADKHGIDSAIVLSRRVFD